MAKLKFNELELQAQLPESNPLEQREKALDAIKEEFKLDQMKQNIASLADGVSSLNQHLISKEKQLSNKIDEVKHSVDQIDGISEEQIEGLHTDIRNVEENLQEMAVRLAQRIQSVEVKLNEPSQPVEQKVEHVTVHKDHSDEIKDIKRDIEILANKAQHKCSKSKVVEIKREPSKQKYINIALGVGLLVALLLNVL